ncbi:MAG: PQQ-binding-like beta-propeller repeat protein [Acidobacteria bacterium]|nr:PQQ-binding-like beta-propeller repeat protein [Acidobacteriota bacterium]
MGLWLLLAVCVRTAFAQTEPGEFRFIATADVHYGAFPECRTWFDRMIADVNTMTPRPAFVLSCGDLTEIGSDTELNGYIASAQALQIPLYNTPGNHDVKWSSLGKAGLRDLFGPLYYSFDYDRFHFISLDVTVTLQQYAHVEKGQLDWLRQDLQAVGRARPVILFMHHPIGRDKTYADNQYEVLKLLSEYNVVLVLQGHEHTEQQWNENGATLVDVANLYGNRTQTGYYRILHVKDEAITMYSKRSTETQSLPRAVIDTRPARRRGRVQWSEPPRPISPGSRQYRAVATVAGAPMTPDYVDRPITDDGVYWNGAYQFSLRTPADADSLLKMRINRNSAFLAVAFQARRVDGTWAAVDWQAKPADDMQRPDDGRVWGDLTLRVPRGTTGPFRLVAKESSAPELNAYRLWLVNDREEVLDTIDVGNAASETAHQVVVTGRIRTETTTERYPTAVRYWLDLNYTGGRQSMTRRPDGLWEAGIDTTRLRPGRHTLKVQLIDDAGAAVTDYLTFEIPSDTVRPWQTLVTGGGVQSSPVFTQDRLYVGSNDGNVYAFDAQTAETLWAFETGDQVLASPAVDNDVVYIGSSDSNFYALDAVTGDPLWTLTTGGPIFGGAEANEGVVYFGSGDRCLYAVDAVTGERLWAYETGNLIQMKPAVRDGVIYFGAWDNYAYALNSSDGQLLWRTRIGSSIYYAPAQMTPIVLSDSVVFSAPTGVHYRLDRQGGQQIGETFPQPAGSFGYNAGILDGPTLYVVSFGGVVIRYDMSPAAPRELWRVPLGSQVVNSGLALSDGKLYTGGLRGLALAVTADRGAPVFDHQLSAEGFIFSAPTLGLGRLDPVATAPGSVSATWPNAWLVEQLRNLKSGIGGNPEGFHLLAGG